MTGYDVLVVGGRVAGASTAMLLARSGLRVALVERSRPGDDTVSTHALMRAGVLQLSRWGLLERVVAAGTPPIRRTDFHYDRGEHARVSIRPGPEVDALYAPRRHLLDRILADAAAEAGAEVRHRTVVTGLLRGDDGRVQGVRAVTPAGRVTTARATVTIGADGIGSRVARDVGAPVVRRGRHAGAILYRYVEDLSAQGYEWAYRDHAAAGLIPTNDGRTCVFVATSPERLRKLRRSGAESAFAALLAAAGPALEERVHAASAAGRLHGWGGLPARIRGAWGPGWALVGDAGYFKDPITTHGMTDALRNAELLARAVLQTFGDTPEATALAAYQRTRDELSRELFEVTDEVAGYDWDGPRVQGLVRRVSSAMSDEMNHLTALAADEPLRPTRFAGVPPT